VRSHIVFLIGFFVWLASADLGWRRRTWREKFAKAEWAEQSAHFAKAENHESAK
jgi:hypothetical protein